MSPALDLADEGASHHVAEEPPLLTRGLMALFLGAYIGAGDRKSPAVTPFYADFSGLGPVLVHVGSWELLVDDSRTVVERLKAAGVDASLKIFDGMVHSWQLFAPMLDEAWPRSRRRQASCTDTCARHARFSNAQFIFGRTTMSELKLEMTRRRLLQGAGMTTAAALAAPAFVRNAFAAGETINIGWINARSAP